MRLLLTVAACVLVNVSFAQISFFAKPKQTFNFQNVLTTPKNEAGNSKTIILPQDKMPCQVTDVTAIAAIPNAVSSFDNNTIPNASPKQEVIPAFKGNALVAKTGNGYLKGLFRMKSEFNDKIVPVK